MTPPSDQHVLRVIVDLIERAHRAASQRGWNLNASLHGVTGDVVASVGTLVSGDALLVAGRLTVYGPFLPAKPGESGEEP